MVDSTQLFGTMEEMKGVSNQIKIYFSRHSTIQRKFKCNNLHCTYNMSCRCQLDLNGRLPATPSKYNINIHIIQSGSIHRFKTHPYHVGERLGL